MFYLHYLQKVRIAHYIQERREEHQTANSTVRKIGSAASTFNIQHSTFNIQHSTFNIGLRVIIHYNNSKMSHSLIKSIDDSFCCEKNETTSPVHNNNDSASENVTVIMSDETTNKHNNQNYNDSDRMDEMQRQIDELKMSVEKIIKMYQSQSTHYHEINTNDSESEQDNKSNDSSPANQDQDSDEKDNENENDNDSDNDNDTNININIKNDTLKTKKDQLSNMQSEMSSLKNNMQVIMNQMKDFENAFSTLRTKKSIRLFSKFKLNSNASASAYPSEKQKSESEPTKTKTKTKPLSDSEIKRLWKSAVKSIALTTVEFAILVSFMYEAVHILSLDVNGFNAPKRRWWLWCFISMAFVSVIYYDVKSLSKPNSFASSSSSSSPGSLIHLFIDVRQYIFAIWISVGMFSFIIQTYFTFHPKYPK